MDRHTTEYEAVPGGGGFFVDVRRLDDFRMPRHHFHEEYEVYYQMEGERLYWIGDRSYSMKPGDLVCIDVRTLHRTRKISESYVRGLVHFGEKFVEGAARELLELFRGSPVIRLNVRQREPFDRLFGTMAREFERREAGWELYCRLALSELLLLATRLAAGQREEQQAAADPAIRQIEKALHFLSAQYRSPVTLAEAAAHLHWSPSHFSRMFVRATGFTFVEYVHQLRVLEAQRLLAGTKLRMLEIADAVGFDNLTHFGRVFKAVSGTTPTAYRRRHQ